jgi:pimeloyl-ACP methyl ester carboxylesterase
MSKPLMYLLAGNGSAADWWDDVLPHFCNYRVQALELPGFGDNPRPPCADLAGYADALLEITEPGHAIFAVGVGALMVLQALQRRPGHFTRSVLLAPVGAFLWQRRLPALMAPLPLRKGIHWLLARRPHWFAGRFSGQRWSAATYRRMGAGYARCRAFVPLWQQLRADTALPMLEWISDPVELVWGDQDQLLGIAQTAAWSAILARADLHISLQAGWGHYPWVDAPAAFAAWLEGEPRGFVAHTKGGRLRLAELAGQAVPQALTVDQVDDPRLTALLRATPDQQWAVRSSSYREDQADAANAGLSNTYLRVPTGTVPTRVSQLLAQGVEQVVVQRFISPKLSGIAFVRHLAVELEWVEGHLECLAEGQHSRCCGTSCRAY